MKYLPLILLILTACSLPVRRQYTSKEIPVTITHKKTTVSKSSKRFKIPSFYSDALTAVISKDNPIKEVKNPSPKIFETFLMSKNSLLFVNLKRGKISDGKSIIEIVLKSGESLYLKETDCHGREMKMRLEKFAGK